MTNQLPRPDLSERPFGLSVQRTMTAPPDVLYRAWTQQFDRWFAVPGTVRMAGDVDTTYYFETGMPATEPDPRPGQPVRMVRYPHYGRFLKLEPDRLVQLTWVTGAGGTEGAETVVTVELKPHDAGTHLRLTHEGFRNAATRDQHEEAWPVVLEQLDAKMIG